MVVLPPLQAAMAYPSVNALAHGFAAWDDASMLVNAEKMMPSQDKYTNLHAIEGRLISFPCCFLSYIISRIA